jgi:hypothetical protein
MSLIQVMCTCCHKADTVPYQTPMRRNEMSSIPASLHRWIARDAGPAPRSLDPADMGTCLGLEMTLGAELPPAPQTVPAPVGGPESASHWWRRPRALKAQAA